MAFRRCRLVGPTLALAVSLGWTITANPLAAQEALDAAGDPLPRHAMARLGTLRWRQTFSIQKLTLSSDGKVLTAVSDNEGAVHWDAATGKRLPAASAPATATKAEDELHQKRAILLHWDNGFLKYEWRSRSAVLSNTRIRRLSDQVEPLRDTVAADPSIAQEWAGIDMSASVWCVGEQPYMKLQEFKHSYGGRDRVLTLLILEDAEPRSWDRTWQDKDFNDD